MTHEHFNARRGDISQMGIAQANREVGRPAYSTGSKLVAFIRKGNKGHRVSATGRANEHKNRELTGRMRKARGSVSESGGVRDKWSLVREGRDGARSEAAARGRGDRRRVRARRGATRSKTRIIMKAAYHIKETKSQETGNASLLAATRRRAKYHGTGLTNGTPSHKGTSLRGAQSACRASAHAVPARRAG